MCGIILIEFPRFMTTICYLSMPLVIRRSFSIAENRRKTLLFIAISCKFHKHHMLDNFSAKFHRDGNNTTRIRYGFRKIYGRIEVQNCKFNLSFDTYGDVRSVLIEFVVFPEDFPCEMFS